MTPAYVHTLAWNWPGIAADTWLVMLFVAVIAFAINAFDDLRGAFAEMAEDAGNETIEKGSDK